MSDFYQKIVELENDPEFRKMTYAEQVELRRQAALRTFARDPGFSKMPDKDKAETVERVALRPPSFENQKYGEEFNKLVGAYVSEQANKKQALAELEKLRKGEGSQYKVQDLVKMSNENTFTREINGQVLYGNALHPYTLAAVGTKGVTEVAKFVRKMLRLEEPTMNTYDLTWGKDGIKGREYLEMMIEKQEGKIQAFLSTTGGKVLGTTLNVASYAMLTGGTLPTNTINKVVIPKIANAITGTGLFQKLFASAIKEAGPHVVKAIGAGMVGVVDETIRQMSGVNQQSTAQIARTFGTWAASDLAWSMASRSALTAFTKSVGAVLGRSSPFRRTASYGSLMSDVVEAMPDDYFRIKEIYLRGDEVSPATLSRLPQQLQDHLAQWKAVYPFMRSTKRGLAEIHPEIKTRIAALDVGVSATPLEGGTWRLNSINDANFNEIRSNIVDVNLRLRELQTENLKGLDKEALVVAKSNPWWTRSFEDMPENVNRVLGKTTWARDPNIPAEVRAAMKKGTYVDIAKRGVINENELASVLPKLKEQVGAQRMFVLADDARLAKIDTDLRAYVDTDTVIAFPQEAQLGDVGKIGKRTDALVVAQRVAPLDEYQAAAQRAVDLKSKLGLSDDVKVLQRYLLMEKGFDAAQVEQGGALELFYPGTQMKLIDNRVSSLTGRLSKAGPSGDMALSEGGVRAYVKASFDLTYGGPVADAKALTGLLSEIKGKVAKNSVGDFVRTYAKGIEGMQTANVNVVLDESLDALGTVKVVRTGAPGNPTIQVTAPKRLYTPSARKTFAGELVKGLNDLGVPVKGTKQVSGQEFVRSLVGRTSRYELPIDLTQAEQVAWLTDVTKNLDTKVSTDPSTKEFVVRLKGGGEARFKEWPEAMDAVLKDTVSEKQMMTTLAEQGYVLKKNPTTSRYSVVDSTGQPVNGWEGATVAELIGSTGIRPKLDASLGPRIVKLDAVPGTFKYESGTVTGGVKKVAKFLNQYEDWRLAEMRKVFNFEHGDVLKYGDAHFEVIIPEAGIRRSFDNLADAQKLLCEYTSPANVWSFAEAKGYKLGYTDAGYRMTGHGDSFNLRTVEDVFEKLREIPDPSWAPPVLPADVDDALREVTEALKLKNPVDPGYPDWFKTPQLWEYKTSIVPGIIEMTLPRRNFLQMELQRLGRDDVLAIFRDMDKGISLWKYDAARGENVLSAMFKVKNEKTGKMEMLPTEKRILIADWLELDDDAAMALAKRHNMTTADLNVAHQVRDYYDKSFAKFGFDGKLWRTKYVPHIRKFLEGMSPSELNALGASKTIEEALGKIYGAGRVPKEITFWARHTRVSDFLQDFMNRDALEIMLRYNTHGLRRLYLNTSWDRLSALVESKTLPKNISDNLALYFKQITGTDETYVEGLFSNFSSKLTREMEKVEKQFAEQSSKAVRAAGKTQLSELSEEVLDKLTLSKRTAMQEAYSRIRTTHEGTLSKLYGLNYAAYMGFRPWTTIRNMGQVYTTLGPLVGNPYVRLGMEDVAKFGDEIVDAMRTKGLILETPPVLESLVQGEAVGLKKLAPKTLRQKGIEVSLRGIKTSDDWSRAVAWQATSRKWADMLDLMKKGKLKTVKEAFDWADWDLLPTDIYKRATLLMEKGNVNGALDVVGTEVVETSMFMYRQSAYQPWRRGLIGKLFGQYGTYAGSYVGGILQTMGSQASKAKKALYALRFLGNTTAIAAALKAAGIDNRDFLPWKPMQFTGGPNYWLMNSVISSFGSDYRARQARSEVDRSLPVNLAQTVATIAQIPSGQKSWDDVQLKFNLPTAYVPGWYQAKAAYDAVNLWDEGKVWQGWLRLFGAPLAKDPESSP